METPFTSRRHLWGFSYPQSQLPLPLDFVGLRQIAVTWRRLLILLSLCCRSFAEIQKQLSWLSSQPHTHKVIIAGNHDVLFDQSFLDLNKDRFPIEQGQTAADLDFGSVIYLQDSSTILDFPVFGRKCTIYGSPWTPKYVNSAFQYSRDDDIWAKRILKETDILLTHGPPYGHLDGLLRHGCRYLATAIEKQRPKLVVFGHIHAAYGRENVRYDGLRKLYEDIERGWSGWEVITAMFALLVWARMSFALGLRKTD